MKVIIIGSGLLGVATAYFLGQQGHTVEVFDRKEGPGMDTSYANGGMLTPSQSEPWNKPGIFWQALAWLGREDSPFLVRPRALFSACGWGLRFIRNSSQGRFQENMKKNARLATYSVRLLRELRRKHGLHYDENINGTVKISTNREIFVEMLEHTRFYQELGVAYRTLTADEVVELEPSLSVMASSIIGGIYYPDDESGDAHKFCQVLAACAEQTGVRFHYQVDVAGFESNQKEIKSIYTSRGKQVGDIYVLAAGCYSTHLARSVQLRLPVQPVKGYSLTYDVNGWKEGPRLPVVDESEHIAIVPLGSRLRVAGTAELTGYDLSIRAGRIQHMSQYISRIYPAYTKALAPENITAWTGLRPYSSDGVPVLGKTRYENLYLNTGHGHLGWSMAVGSGRLVADIICGNQPGLDPAPYRLDR